MSSEKGELEKLRLEDADDSGVFYDVLFNPENYTESVEIKYDLEQASGTSGTSLTFEKITPGEYTLNLVFDSTGMAKAILGSDPGSVADQIAKFKKVTLDYKGDTHMPPEVKLSWGTWIFTGRLIKLEVKYEIFRPGGTPIRAKGTAVFKANIEDELRAAQENKSSPDLTHIRTVQAGDTLPLMCHRIYGDSGYYMKVAEANQINDFRNLTPGQKIYFPPLAKTTEASNA
ncbi:MAG TPA: hypothetical protein DCR93_09965 [Cytophagales bacterium]|nr:hypothetical protein [Cytophagales bacterium]